ncbi:MAG: hypothetical protein R3F13_10040 [Prosthecobacter sp.]
MKTALFLTALLFTALAHAGPRNSTDYRVATDSTDAGGKRAASVSYTNEGSVGGVSGTSDAAAPVTTAKAGYMGQLYEVTALQIAASPATVNELGTRQLGAAQVLDDLTTIVVPPSSIAWSVSSGPLSSIDADGLATAAAVYTDTAAVAQGSFAGVNGTLNLTVLDTIPDNFGSYAGDGIADDWQQQYFGLNNPNAAPGLDPDGDGHTNQFEFTAGLNPVNSVARFLLSTERVTGQINIVFGPVLAGRTYTVKSSLMLGAGAMWEDLTSFSTSDDGSTRTVTDLDAGGTRKFYRVEITQP